MAYSLFRKILMKNQEFILFGLMLDINFKSRLFTQHTEIIINFSTSPCTGPPSPCYGSVYTILNNANSLTWLNLSSSKPCAGVTTDKKYNLGTVLLWKLPSFSYPHFKNSEKRIFLFYVSTSKNLL
mgnify:CR=1 FL=1